MSYTCKVCGCTEQGPGFGFCDDCATKMCSDVSRYPLIEDCAKCRDCKDPVHDFHVPDDMWMNVVGDPNVVLCWDCFDDLANQQGIWKLVAVVMTMEEFYSLVE